MSLRPAIAPVVLALACAFAAPARAADLAAAERSYRAGDYEAALRAIEAEIARAHDPSPALLYDAGNCRFRLGRFAEAALAYRRALLRDPRDATARFNLRLAESRLGIAPPPPETLLDAARSVADDTDPWAFLLAAAALESAGLALLLAARRRRGLRVAALAALLAAAVAAGLFVRRTAFPRPPAALVLAPEAKLRAEPRADLPVTLTVKAGEVVTLLERTDRWARVRFDDRVGWTPSDHVGAID